jgi:hypothetical protein
MGVGFPNPFSGIHNPGIHNPFSGIPNPFVGVASFRFPVPKPEDWPQKAADFVRGVIDAGLAPIVSGIVGAYFLFLETQANGKLKQIPEPLRSWLQPHYNIGLEEVYYAERIDTIFLVDGKPAAVTVENHIYFPQRIDLSNCDDAHWLMHELEHSVQYRTLGGKVPFVTKYAAQIPEKIMSKGTFSPHDVLEMELKAEAKANSLKQEICDKIAQHPSGFSIDGDSLIPIWEYAIRYLEIMV